MAKKTKKKVAKKVAKKVVKKVDNLIRINSRVRVDQHQFVKTYAENADMGEGEVHRLIIDYFMQQFI